MVTLLEDNDGLSCLSHTHRSPERLKAGSQCECVSVCANGNVGGGGGCKGIKVDVKAGYSVSDESKLSSFPFTAVHGSEWGRS